MSDADNPHGTVPPRGSGGSPAVTDRAIAKARESAVKVVDVLLAILDEPDRHAGAQVSAAKLLLQMAYGTEFVAAAEGKVGDAPGADVKVIPQEEAVRQARTLRLAELAERKRAG